METKLLFSFPETVLKSLSAWLLHSLWAGVVLAVLASVVMLATRRAPARKRYNLLLACITCFALMMCVILGVGLYTFTGHGTISGIVPVLNQPVAPAIIPAHQQPPVFTARLLQLVDEYSLAIVSAWMIVVLARSLRLAGALYNIHLLRSRNNEPVTAAWQQRLEQLAVSIGLNRHVSLLQSHAVSVPMVIGHFKPFILLPFSLVTSLPASQVEAILLHELAHIARRDYLVNLLVNLLETIFFFNPAVIWVSSLLRKERENCCDDMTVRHVSDPRDYIEALLWCQQRQQDPAPAFATALLDQPRHLLGRVKRIINKNNNRTLNNMEKSIVSISLVTAGLLVMAFTVKTDVPERSGHASTNAVPKCPENGSVFLNDYWNRQYLVRDTVPPPPP
ncbi:MAG: M56 family metallopeptidase, partial [Chitinophagaceae bacterium]